MSTKKVAVEQFGQAICAIVQDYADGKTRDAKSAVKTAGEELVAELKSTSPRSSNRGKHYASGWKMETQNKVGEGASVIVKNKVKPALTHLLENGHEKRGGGFVAAIPHIAPATEKAAAKLRELMSR